MKLRSMFSNDKEIYTGASKQDDIITYCHKDGAIILGYRMMPQQTSIFTTEIRAIGEAIHFDTKAKGKSVIYSESLSSILTLKNNQVSNNLHIHYLKSFINNSNSMIAISWVPPHKQIRGNEHASKTAKDVLKLPLILTMSWNADFIPCIKTKEVKKLGTIWYRLFDKINYRYIDKKRLIKLSD